MQNFQITKRKTRIKKKIRSFPQKTGEKNKMNKCAKK